MAATPEQRDMVEEYIADSFPASDPPAWTSTGVGDPHDAAAEAIGTPADDELRGEDNVLLLAMRRLENALAAADHNGGAHWAESIVADLESVVECLEVHKAAADAPNGLYAQIDTTRQSLIREIERLRAHHRDLIAQAKALTELARSCAAEAQPDDDVRYLQLRERAESLLLELRQHQTREADLAVQTFNLDLGAGD